MDVSLTWILVAAGYLHLFRPRQFVETFSISLVVALRRMVHHVCVYHHQRDAPRAVVSSEVSLTLVSFVLHLNSLLSFVLPVDLNAHGSLIVTRSATYVFTSYFNATGFESKGYVYMLGSSKSRTSRKSSSLRIPSIVDRLGPHLRRNGYGSFSSHG